MNNRIYKLFDDLKGNIEEGKATNSRIEGAKSLHEEPRIQEIHDLKELNSKLNQQLTVLGETKTKEIDSLNLSIKNLKGSILELQEVKSKQEKSLKVENNKLKEQMEKSGQDIDHIFAQLGGNADKLISATISEKLKALKNCLGENEKRNKEVEKLQLELENVKKVVVEKEKYGQLGASKEDLLRSLEKKVGELEVIVSKVYSKFKLQEIVSSQKDSITTKDKEIKVKGKELEEQKGKVIFKTAEVLDFFID